MLGLFAEMPGRFSRGLRRVECGLHVHWARVEAGFQDAQPDCAARAGAFLACFGGVAVCCMGASKRLGGVSVLRAMLRVHSAEAGGIKTAASGN